MFCTTLGMRIGAFPPLRRYLGTAFLFKVPHAPLSNCEADSSVTRTALYNSLIKTYKLHWLGTRLQPKTLFEGQGTPLAL